MNWIKPLEQCFKNDKKKGIIDVMHRNLKPVSKIQKRNLAARALQVESMTDELVYKILSVLLILAHEIVHIELLFEFPCRYYDIASIDVSFPEGCE